MRACVRLSQVHSDTTFTCLRCTTCSANIILHLLCVTDFIVSLLWSATWLAAAVIRSSGAGATAGRCKRAHSLLRHTTRRQTTCQRSSFFQHSCGKSAASASGGKLCIGASARLHAWHKSEVRKPWTTLHRQLLCRRFLTQHQRHIWSTV